MDIYDELVMVKGSLPVDDGEMMEAEADNA